MKTKLRAWKGWIIFCVGLIMAGRTMIKIWSLWQARQIVAQTQERVDRVQAENEQLQKRLAEVSSDTFVEKEAREKLGLGKPGETILILPNQGRDLRSQILDVRDEPNWKKWWDLYVGLP